ncbi:hypothetical protein C8R44DRAFT_836546 [Mycena epipterygia]|nr:hypothetical protein C8R44DRAFT_836546 [Mycena epipterygia]
MDLSFRRTQHDDQILHELTVNVLHRVLCTPQVIPHSVRPARRLLVALLYSDKKPGAVATRQLIYSFIRALLLTPAPPPAPVSPDAFIEPGGVECEAMGDFTTHLKLINTIAKAVAEPNLPKEHTHSALVPLMWLGRRSTMYYPMLHLELVRYLPWTVSRLVGMPPPALAKSG